MTSRWRCLGCDKGCNQLESDFHWSDMSRLDERSRRHVLLHGCAARRPDLTYARDLATCGHAVYDTLGRLRCLPAHGAANVVRIDCFSAIQRAFRRWQRNAADGGDGLVSQLFLFCARFHVPCAAPSLYEGRRSLLGLAW